MLDANNLLQSEYLINLRKQEFNKYILSKGYCINQANELWYYRKHLIQKSDINVTKLLNNTVLDLNTDIAKIKLFRSNFSNSNNNIVKIINNIHFKPHTKLFDVYEKSVKPNYVETKRNRKFVPIKLTDRDTYLEMMFAISPIIYFELMKSKRIQLPLLETVVLIGGGTSIEDIVEIYPNISIINIDICNKPSISLNHKCFNYDFLELPIDFLKKLPTNIEVWSSYSLFYYCQNQQELISFFKQCNWLIKNKSAIIRICPIEFSTIDECKYKVLLRELEQQLFILNNCGINISSFDKTLILF